MAAVLAQAYFGSRGNLSDSKMAQIRNLFGDQDVVTKGLLSDLMYGNTSSKATAQRLLNPDEWNETSSFDFVNEAGWYFKTLAAQEPGEDSVLFATYGRRYKNVSTSTHLLPFFGTDYGLCRYVLGRNHVHLTIRLGFVTQHPWLGDFGKCNRGLRARTLRVT